MRQRTYISLALILLLAVLCGWLALTNPVIQIGSLRKDVRPHLGLDLQGGLRVLLQADVPPGTVIDADSIRIAKEIIEKRVNALGVVEPLIQIQGNTRIVVELPGIANPDEAIRAFGGTGLLEFVDAGDTPPAEGSQVGTTGQMAGNSCSGAIAATNTPTPGATGAATQVPSIAPTGAITSTGAISPTTSVTSTGTISPTGSITSTETISPTQSLTETTPIEPTQLYTTVMTGDCLQTASVVFDQNTNQPEIAFSLKSTGAKIFGDFTSANVGKFLAIVLDKKVISAPRVQTAITNGEGRITGQFTIPEANNLAVQLRFGALPIPLRIETTTNIGPTLGQDSINRSVIAGIIGVGVVALFMLLYYRLPGLLADIALFIYGLIVFAIYKAGVPGVFDFVTLTLPGIAGFVLSLGVAVDANILIFERMKEELREGRSLPVAIENGFNRAWPSIRDSNSSTLITSAILLWFGSTFGASIVAGFALTLGIGVLVSLFTAVIVTRTFLRFILDLNPSWNLWLFGVSPRKESDKKLAAQSSS